MRRYVLNTGDQELIEWLTVGLPSALGGEQIAERTGKNQVTITNLAPLRERREHEDGSITGDEGDELLLWVGGDPYRLRPEPTPEDDENCADLSPLGGGLDREMFTKLLADIRMYARATAAYAAAERPNSFEFRHIIDQRWHNIRATLHYLSEFAGPDLVPDPFPGEERDAPELARADAEAIKNRPFYDWTT